MARMTISVPDELRSRMEVVASRLNWSGIAARAFEVAVLQVEAGMSGDLETGLARLRAEKAEMDEEEKGDGLNEGRRWALEDATVRELRFVVSAGEKDIEEARRLVMADAQDLNGVLDPTTAEMMVASTEAWTEGFIAGATEVWRKV